MNKDKTRKTVEQFIADARIVHGDKYDYSKVIYVNNKTKVCVICPVHGEFWITPNSHLRGRGCPECGKINRVKSNRRDLDDFIAKARAVHGDRYIYPEQPYINNKTKITIICPIHGPFEQQPNAHLSGQGCPECGRISRILSNSDTTESFIAKAMIKHNGKYSYPNTDYKDSYTPVKIECPIHGEFEQRPNAHLNGQGCPKCGLDTLSKKLKSNIDEFISKARIVHGDVYDYSQSIYRGNQIRMTIICPKHGPFEQTPNVHLRGCGCPKCSIEKISDFNRMTTQVFIAKSRLVHGDKFDYVNVDYKNNSTKVCIICPIHGEFWQTPNEHLSGRGCPICKESHGEKIIRMFLEKFNISYCREHCIYPEQVLFGRNRFIIDFYLPDYNTFIEFHGRQHFSYNEFFHRSSDSFADQQDRDRRLRDYCKQHKIRLIEIPYTEIDDIDKILTRKLLKSKRLCKLANTPLPPED